MLPADRETPLSEETHFAAEADCATQCAIDDPVPGDAESCLYGSGVFRPHLIEEEVQRALLSIPNVEFASLQVHRMADGICLTGIIKVPEGSRPPQLDRLVAKSVGVTRVLNHLVVQRK